MTYLVEVNGSQPSLAALRYAAARCNEPGTRAGKELVLLHVAPSARPAEIASGKRLLDECRAACRFLPQEVRVRTCLEVGDRVERLAEAADRETADCVVVGSHDAGEFPHLRELGEVAGAAVARLSMPVVIVGRSGVRCFDRGNQGGSDGLGA
jgi:nucleotide-binding universal stress UspA family protein